VTEIYRLFKVQMVQTAKRLNILNGLRIRRS
jgi:hypothetical protein